MTNCTKCSQQGFLESPAGFATTAIHAGQSSDKWKCLSIAPPISMSSTYKQPGPGQPKNHIYSRVGNPSRNTLEECLAALERAKYCLTFASGMGAITTAVLLLKRGQHIVAMNDVYGGTHSLFSNIVCRMGIEVTFTDLSVSGNLEKSIKPNTKMIFFETPSNPVLKVIDIAAISKAAKSYDDDILVVVDNTFLTPYLQKPLKFGADIVLYSITKYMNGHTDVVMGAMLVNDKKIADKLRYLQGVAGIVPSPFDCYMVNRSLKTLALRMERHKESGLLVAGWLDMHPKIVEVLHPGLPTHPDHDLARRQMCGHSGVFSFRHCGDLKESKKFLSALKYFTLAVSLGGYESLVEIPSLMTHSFIPEKERLALGITNSLIRLSIGLEDVLDLIEDLDRALRIAFE